MKERITGAEALMRSLINEGVSTIFGYPGGAIMPVYDALYDHKDELNHILVRHEQGATHAAQGYARVSGKPGCCIVTSGPGATNTVTGIADAMIDSTPMVVICGQVGTSLLGTDAFQEVFIARSGRPGPVVLDFAKNAQTSMVDYEPVKVDFIRSYNPVPKPDESAIAQAAKMINDAVKPFALVGQGVELGNAREELMALLEKAQIPAGCTLLGLSALPTDHPLNMGMLGMHGNLGPNVMTNQCDLLIAIGMRFDDRVTGNLATYAKQAKIIHFDIDPSEINKNVKVDLAILGNCKETLAKVAEQVEKTSHDNWINSFKPYEEKEFNKVINKTLNPTEGPLLMGEVVRKVSEASENKAILVTDVGQNQMFGCRYFKFTEARSVVTSGGCGTMGFGLGAAMGTKLGNPTKTVFNIAGDGCFRMNMNELATLSRYNIPVIQVIINNQVLGMVRQWQTLFYGKRYSNTILSDKVDFCKVAEGLGCKAIKVTTKEEVSAAIKEAIEYEGPVVIECVIDKDDKVFPMVAPGTAIAEVFDAEDLKKK